MNRKLKLKRITIGEKTEPENIKRLSENKYCLKEMVKILFCARCAALF